MRKSGSGTPTIKKKNDSSVQKESGGKKLVQARLPFKVLTTGSPLPVPAVTTVDLNDEENVAASLSTSLEPRKRKLSYEDEEKKTEKLVGNQERKHTPSKENHEVKNKKAKLSQTSPTEEIVVLLDDDDILDNNNDSKGKTKTITATEESSDDKNNSNTIHIKLPLIKKNKRKKPKQKSMLTEQAADEHTTECSDDNEFSSETLNPQKRVKVTASLQQSTENKVIESINLESDSDEKENDANIACSPETTRTDAEIASKKNINTKPTISVRTNEENVSTEKDEGSADVVADVDNIEITTDSRSSTDAVQICGKEVNHTIDSSEANDQNDPKVADIAINEKKTLTPKQIKFNEMRRKAREERERKIQEERLQKQREKEERETAKKREREEKEEQRRKEREEKDEVRRKEREEKELKRQAEIDAKNEEKRRRIEAKEEEVRKKEEERKRKELEKEEVQMKKKKAAEGFKKFFVPKESRVTIDGDDEQGIRDAGDKEIASLAFRPFQIKGDMKLSPVCRRTLQTDQLEALDHLFCTDTDSKVLPVKELYLHDLKTGKITPGIWKSPVAEPDTKEGDDDICIVDDELEVAGQAIVEETHEPVEQFRAKFLKFHENRRPPYYGTWRKRTQVITPRHPFAQDTKFFDYEVDSDLEWEEEEPGESLDGSDDDKEKESEDDDYEVDNEWFVPHGHLSDEELQNEDEGGIDASNDREAQKAKLQILQQEFAQEMKKKTEKIKPRLLGCIWVDENGNQPELCPQIIWDTLNARAMLCGVAPAAVLEPDEPLEKSEPNSPSTLEKTTEKLRPVALSEEMLKGLVRLVHGNRHSKVFLIKEFITYVEANEDAIKNGEARAPLKSVIREKIDKYAEWQAVETKISNKKKAKKKLCWVVSNDVLQRMQLTDLSLHNKWQYALQPKFQNTEAEHKTTNADVDAAVQTNEKQQTSPEVEQEQKAQHKSSTEAIPTVIAKSTNKPPEKKRVQLLMSVPRGQQFSPTAKNALISKFLHPKQTVKDETTQNTTTITQKDETIVLD